MRDGRRRYGEVKTEVRIVGAGGLRGVRPRNGSLLAAELLCAKNGDDTMGL